MPTWASESNREDARLNIASHFLRVSYVFQTSPEQAAGYYYWLALPLRPATISQIDIISLPQ